MVQPALLHLRAPVTGWVVPLERVPDPVFAQRVVGDGLSIDPLSNIVVSPCAGRVAQLHPAGHAITLQTEAGVEVMLHIGLDTVQLEGRGFLPRVETGASVRTGDTLVEFDRDYVGPRARSLLVQVVVTGGARVVFARPSGLVRAGEDTVLEVMAHAFEVAAAEPSQSSTPSTHLHFRSAPITIPARTVLHVRSAAALVARARQFSADLRLEIEHRSANAKSVVALMGLDVEAGDTVRLVGSGRDADVAVRTLTQMIASGLGEPVATDASVNEPGLTADQGSARAGWSRDEVDGRRLFGLPASPGLVVGRILQVRDPAQIVVERGDAPEVEAQRLEDARRRAREELTTLRSRMQNRADSTRAAIFGAHERLLDDPELLAPAEKGVAAGHSAAFAWRQAYSTHLGRLAHLPNDTSLRAADVRDIGERVLRHLVSAPARRVLPPQTILVATDLTPSAVAELDRERVVALCTVGGGPTSHVVLLARSLGLPAIVAIDHRVLGVEDGTLAMVDGADGVLTIEPTVSEVAYLEDRQRQRASREREELEKATVPARTHDGFAVGVLANVGSLTEVRSVLAFGAEGIGLLRSEFLFLGRTTAPSEEEQVQALEAIALAIGPDLPLTIRTLDVGSDKYVPYLPLPREENPSLGDRGPRPLFDRLDIWTPQIRAILRLGATVAARAVVPMIAGLDEWRAIKALFESERAQLGVPPVPLGVMVEVPATALLADQFAEEVDFFSIGTNDLSQFTLAMDRSHPKLAGRLDGLHPAVLRLIAQTVDAAHRTAKRVTVCGALATDEQAIALLVGLGVDELSVPVASVPSVKAWIRTLVRAECEALAERALAACTAHDVRALLPARTEVDLLF
ncbi:MAG: phosphoenolpyruvate--protein phosphotransferase [Vicinamibacterales bacterium]